jgi:hypothetical protein
MSRRRGTVVCQIMEIRERFRMMMVVMVVVAAAGPGWTVTLDPTLG